MFRPLRAGGQVHVMGEAEELLRAHDQADLSLDRVSEASDRLEDQPTRRATRVDIVGVAAGGAADCRSSLSSAASSGAMPTQNTADDSADPCRTPSSESPARPATS